MKGKVLLLFLLSLRELVLVSGQGQSCTIDMRVVSEAMSKLKTLTSSFAGVMEGIDDQDNNLLDEAIPFFGRSVNEIIGQDTLALPDLFDWSEFQNSEGNLTCNGLEALEGELTTFFNVNILGEEEAIVTVAGPSNESTAAASGTPGRPRYRGRRPGLGFEANAAEVVAGADLLVEDSPKVSDFPVAGNREDGSICSSGGDKPITAVDAGNALVLHICYQIVPETPGDATFSPLQVFDELEESISMASDSTFEVISVLTFNVKIEFPYGPDGSSTGSFDLEVGDVRVDVGMANFSTNAEVDVTLGLIKLSGPLEASVKASFTVVDCADMGVCRTVDSQFTLVRHLEYDLRSDGLNIGTTALSGVGPLTVEFELKDDDAFDSSTAPVLRTNSSFLQDLVYFSPTSAVSLLRTVDNVLVRVQKNEALQRPIPLVSSSFSEIISTGSVLFENVVPNFLQVQPVNDRPTESLVIISEGQFGLTVDDLAIEQLNFFFLRGEQLNFNPDRPSQLQEAIQGPGQSCTINLRGSSLLQGFEDVAERFIDGVADCPLRFCGRDDCGCTDLENIAANQLPFVTYKCNQGCDVFVGTHYHDDDADQRTEKFIVATVAGTCDDDEKEIGPPAPGPTDNPSSEPILLFGFETAENTSLSTIFDGTFPVNQPFFPTLVPNFGDIDTFLDRLVSDADVNTIFRLQLSEEGRPQLLADLSLSLIPEVSIGGLDTSSFVDFSSVQVDDVNIDAAVALSASTTIGVSFVTNATTQLDPLLILGRAVSCSEQNCISETTSLDILIRYEQSDSACKPCEKMGTVDLPSLVGMDSNTGFLQEVLNPEFTREFEGIIREVSATDRMYMIEFEPNIRRIDLFVRKDCESIRRRNDEAPRERNVFECSKGFRPIVTPNDYRLTDSCQVKPRFEILVGETAIQGEITVDASADISGRVFDLIYAELSLNAALEMDLALSVGTNEPLLPFLDWLMQVTAIRARNMDSIDGFFSGTADLKADLDAMLKAGDLLDFLEADDPISASLDLAIDFADFGAILPEEIELRFDGFPDQLRFEVPDVLEILRLAFNFLVGDNDGDEVDTCSGGLLGTEIAGRSVLAFNIPFVGVDACQTARFLQTLTNAIDVLAPVNSLDSNIPTIDGLIAELEEQLNLDESLELSLTSKAFADLTGSDDDFSDFHLELDLTWTAMEMSSFLLELEEILDIDAGIFLQTLIPTVDSEFMVGTTINFHLGLGLEYVPDNDPSSSNRTSQRPGRVNPYLLGSTALIIEFEALGNLDFDLLLGPLKANADVEFFVGTKDRPLKLEIGLPNRNFYVGGRDLKPRTGFDVASTINPSLGNILSQTEVIFSGLVQATIDLDVGVFGSANINITLGDLVEFLRNPRQNTTENTIIFSPQFGLEVPSFLDILLSDPDLLVDSLDGVLESVEVFALGAQGVLTRLPVPFLRNSIARELGANTGNNILAQARRRMIPRIRRELEEQENPDTVADSIANLLDDILGDFLLGNVTVNCSDATRQSLNCTEDGIASVQWTVPLGQNLSIPIPLDFEVAPDFPLLVEMTGENEPSLDIGWGFKLGFGFDEQAGFFLDTFPGEEAEFCIEALLNIEGRTLDALLFFLRATFNDMDLMVGAGVFIDLDKASALRLPGDEPRDTPQFGRLTQANFRNITNVRDLFELRAVAGAAFSVDNINLAVDANGFEEIENWIPQLNMKLAAYFTQSIERGGNSAAAQRRRLQSTEPHLRRLGAFHDGKDHPAVGLLRSLALRHDENLLDEGFIFDPCPLESPNSTACAKLTDVTLDVAGLQDLTSQILGNFVKPDGTGILDRAVQPFDPLEKPIPGLSDLAGEDITVLDLAEFVVDKGSDRTGVRTVRRLLRIVRQLQGFADRFAGLVGTDGLVLAEECNLLGGVDCRGGLGDVDESNDNTTRALLEFSEGRQLQTTSSCPQTSGAFQDSDNCPTCSSCTSTARTSTCRALRLRCQAGGIQGLSFPFLANPSSLLNLLTGGDIILLEFEPPEVTFAFSLDRSFVIFTPPLVLMELGFEFAARLKTGFVLDTKGIREAITQNAPFKAVNSLGIRDSFEGVDEPIITLTASVFVGLAVSAAIVTIGIRGGITGQLELDLFDPNPEESGGIVRPFELLSNGLSPSNWLEISFRLSLFAVLFVRVGLDLGLFRVSFTIVEETYSEDLLDLANIPKDPTPCSGINLATGSLLRMNTEDMAFECTSLFGSFGDETIECLCAKDEKSIREGPTGPTINSVVGIRNIDFKEDTLDDVTLRSVKSSAEFGVLQNLVLDYSSGLVEPLIEISSNQIIAGSISTGFESITTSKIILPTLEDPLLTTVIGGYCSSSFVLLGHTNLDFVVNEIRNGCEIDAMGGDTTTGKAVIDFDTMECVDGNTITVDSDGDSMLATMKIRNPRTNEIIESELKLAPSYTDLEVKMSKCSDTVIIKSTSPGSGTVSVSLGEGNDKLVIGNDETGLDTYTKDVFLEGNEGIDILEINDSGSKKSAVDAFMDPATIMGLNIPIVLGGFEKISVKLGTGRNMFDVISTPANSLEVVITGGPSRDVITVEGSRSKAIRVNGAKGDDRIRIEGLDAGTVAMVSGGDGDDTLVLDGVVEGTNETGPINTLDGAAIDWDGGSGDDSAFVHFTCNANVEVTVSGDTAGFNEIKVLCSQSASCTFLTRSTFLANIALSDSNETLLERVRFVENSVSSLQVILGDGKSCIFFDDTVGPTTVFGGNGASEFIVGQLFQPGNASLSGPDLSESLTMEIRDFELPFPLQSHLHLATALPDNAGFDAIRGTSVARGGFLSDGNSHSLLIKGGRNGTHFVDVRRNTAPVLFNGGENNSTGIIVARSFVADVPNANLTNTSSFQENIFRPNFIVNSLLHIVGGRNLDDELLVVGTEFEDSTVISKDTIRGGGLSITYNKIEMLGIAALEGDDYVAVLSTSDPVDTMIDVGEDKEDQLSVTPRLVRSVVSRNARGHRGILEHQVEGDTDFSEVVIPGVGVDITDNDGQYGYFVVEVVGYKGLLTEGDPDSFSLVISLVSSLKEGENVLLDISSERSVTGASYLIFGSDQDGQAQLAFIQNGPVSQTLTIRHNPSATPLSVTASDVFVTIDLNLESTNAQSYLKSQQSLGPVRVKLVPSQSSAEAMSVTVVEHEGGTVVAEGIEGFNATYDVHLRPCTDEMTNRTILRFQFDDEETFQLLLYPENITGTDWLVDEGCKVTVSVSALDDDVEEGIHFEAIHLNITDSNNTPILLTDGTALEADEVVVKIYDDDTASVVVQAADPVGASEQELKGFYQMRLTKDPGENVTIVAEAEFTVTDYYSNSTSWDPNRSFTKRQQLILENERNISEVLFTPDNWAEWQTVNYEAKEDDIVEGIDFYSYASRIPYCGENRKTGKGRRKGQGTPATVDCSQGKAGKSGRRRTQLRLASMGNNNRNPLIRGALETGNVDVPDIASAVLLPNEEVTNFQDATPTPSPHIDLGSCLKAGEPCGGDGDRPCCFPGECEESTCIETDLDNIFSGRGDLKKELENAANRAMRGNRRLMKSS